MFDTIEDEDGILTIRLRKTLSPSTAEKFASLFKTSWYEPKGIIGVQTNKLYKAVERFLIAKYLEEGRLTYEEIREMNLRKKIKKNYNKYVNMLLY